MSLRKVLFENGEFYHCFNRGVDRREIFSDAEDFSYFLTALELFNQLPSRGDMAHYKSIKHQSSVTEKDQPLVSILSYCLNPNHFHLLLNQEVEDGITKFMQKLSTGLTMYFNKKHRRTGSLFQGKFKAVHINNDTQLKHIFAYVTLNNLVHGLTDSKKFRNSFQEATQTTARHICNRELTSSCFGSIDDIQKITEAGMAHTIAYRKSLEDSEKSEFLE